MAYLAKCVYTGLALITARIIGSGNEPKYVGCGTDGTEATQAQSALLAEVATRATGVGTQLTTSQTNDTHKVVGTWTADTARTIQEVGIFESSVAGIMYFRANHGSMVLATGDQIEYTLKVQLT